MGFSAKRQGIAGHVPWSAPDAEKTKDILGYNLPSQEEIDACLSCEKPECTDCVGSKHKMKYYVHAERKTFPKGYLQEEIPRLHREGLSVREIALQIGTTKQTVYLYLKRERKNNESNK